MDEKKPCNCPLCNSEFYPDGGFTALEHLCKGIFTVAENELAGDVLLKFYRALGWNSNDILDPCKIHTTKDVYYHLYDVMLEKCSDSVSVGMFMVNRGPSVDADIPAGKVYLLDGWITSADPQPKN